MAQSSQTRSDSVWAASEIGDWRVAGGLHDATGVLACAREPHIRLPDLGRLCEYLPRESLTPHAIASRRQCPVRDRARRPAELNTHGQALRSHGLAQWSLEERSITHLEGTVQKSFGELGDLSVRVASRYLHLMGLEPYACRISSRVAGTWVVADRTAG